MELMDPVTSQSSLFVERWANSEDANQKLKITVLVLGIVSLFLTVAFVYAVFKPRPIYYIPNPWGAGVAMPQPTPRSTAAVFTASWVLNWTNFTPATVQDIYARAQRFMSPRLLAETQARLSKDIDEVRRNNISSLFSMTGEPSVDDSKNGFLVTLQGDKGLYMGKEEIKVQRMLFRVQVRVVHPTESNPYGLMIENIEQEVIE